MSIRITCINKADGQHENPYVAISHLSWLEDGTKLAGKWTRERLYDWIKVENGYAYVEGGGTSAKVITALSIRGTKYVKTEADSTERDNLLKLSECP